MSNITYNNKINRESNFELLRIIAMMFIISHHLSCFGYFEQASDKLSILLNNIFATLLVPLGKLGVVLFVLITGYFMINSKAKIKSWLNLYFQTLIYSCSILGIFILSGADVSKDDILKSLLPISHSTYWFITTYLILYFLIPALNYLLKIVENKKYECYLLGTFTFIYLFIHTYITSFIYLYILGGYIKKGIFPLNKIKIKYCIYTILCLSLFEITYSFITVLLCSEPGQMLNAMHKLSVMHSPFLLIFALCIFYIIKNFKIKTDNIINSIAISVFPVYLIHENFLIRPILWENIMKILNQTSPKLFILIVILITIGILLGCILIDKLFGYLYKPIIKIIVNSITNMTDKAMLKLEKTNRQA